MSEDKITTAEVMEGIERRENWMEKASKEGKFFGNFLIEKSLDEFNKHIDKSERETSETIVDFLTASMDLEWVENGRTGWKGLISPERFKKDNDNLFSTLEHLDDKRKNEGVERVDNIKNIRDDLIDVFHKATSECIEKFSIKRHEEYYSIKGDGDERLFGANFQGFRIFMEFLSGKEFAEYLLKKKLITEKESKTILKIREELLLKFFDMREVYNPKSAYRLNVDRVYWGVLENNVNSNKELGKLERMR